jgi:hypothetical protein
MPTREYVIDTVIPGGAEGAAAYMNGTPIQQPGFIPGHPETALTIESGVQKPFKLLHIVVDPECAAHFVIHHCWIGTKAAWKINGNGVPASLFTATDPTLDCPTAQPHVFISLSVDNKSSEPQRFRATLLGEETDDYAEPEGLKIKAPEETVPLTISTSPANEAKQ